eukprot:scaffold8668_cov89-Skeletonema_dohrnii-CCMP3373.AAC.4
MPCAVIIGTDNNIQTTMSVDQTEADMCCASCGIAELDDIKLMDCDDCDLVRYCSDECQKDHLPHHEAMCKKRAAELRDEKLFRQPESNHLGDCPICFLPLPLDHQKSVLNACCSTTICNGCAYANQKRELEEKLQPACPFCRNILPATKEENNKNKMKRVAANDPVAIREIGVKHYSNGDYERAFDYLIKAAELGDASAHYDLSHLYRKGEGVEKDEKKGLYYLEEAAIAGHPDARYDLALKEGRDSRFDRSARHFIIAANLGRDGSIQALKVYYRHGIISKDEFAAALRAHQAAVDATKSPQREEAAEYFRRRQLE